MTESFEFKFARSASFHDRRRAFFRAAKEHEFRFVVCAYDKTKLDSRSFSKNDFHWGTSIVLATYLRSSYEVAEAQLAPEGHKPKLLRELVVVDDNQDQKFLTMLKNSFRAMQSQRFPGKPLVGKVRFRDSKPDEML